MASKQLRSFFFTTSGDTTRGGFWTRFLSGSKPSQSTFEDLLESTPFFKESGSAASKDTGQALELKQGIVIISSDANAKAGTNTAGGSTGGSIVVQPSQLPIIKAENQIIDPSGITTFDDVTFESVVDTGVTTRNEFKIGFSSAFITWLKAALIAVRVLPSGGTTGQSLKKVDGTDFNTTWDDDNTGAVAVNSTNGSSGGYTGAELTVSATSATSNGVTTITYTLSLASAFWTWLLGQFTSIASSLSTLTTNLGTTNTNLSSLSSTVTSQGNTLSGHTTSINSLLAGEYESVDGNQTIARAGSGNMFLHRKTDNTGYEWISVATLKSLLGSLGALVYETVNNNTSATNSTSSGVIFTAGANGTKVVGLTLEVTSTTGSPISVTISGGGFSYYLDSPSIGTTDVLATMSLPKDSDGNKYFNVSATDDLSVIVNASGGIGNSITCSVVVIKADY